jgi:GNAT superfamily N-acetyltransferase
MIVATDRTTGIEVCTSLGTQGMSSGDIQRVIEGASNEDMFPVTVDDILGSYATFGAFLQEDGEQRMVGFARQLHRDSMQLPEGERLSVTELGTVWVDPAYRGRSIGPFLIRSATQLMQVVGFVPVAVCNERSRSKFEAEGYTPVGVLPRENGHDRVVEMYEANSDWRFTERWHDGLRAETLTFMQSLPRFQKMRILTPQP